MARSPFHLTSPFFTQFPMSSSSHNARRIALTLFRDAVEDLDGNREILTQALKDKTPNPVTTP